MWNFSPNLAPVLFISLIAAGKSSLKMILFCVNSISLNFEPMINKDNMLSETSTLVSKHVIQGKDAVEVIDELEVIFHRHYELTKQEG